MRLAGTNLNEYTAGVSQKDQMCIRLPIRKRLDATSEGEAVLPQLAGVCADVACGHPIADTLLIDSRRWLGCRLCHPGCSPLVNSYPRELYLRTERVKGRSPKYV